MTEETAKIFNAPWKAEKYKHGKGAFVVRNNGGYLVAENISEQDAGRLARLPELYDALMEGVEIMCRYWNEPSMCKMCEHKGECIALKWKDLLRKVRDGEGVPETNQN